MMVSFSASAARLSHGEANAGSADRHARTHVAHVIVEIFIRASESRRVYTGLTPQKRVGYAPWARSDGSPSTPYVKLGNSSQELKWAPRTAHRHSRLTAVFTPASRSTRRPSRIRLACIWLISNSVKRYSRKTLTPTT